MEELDVPLEPLIRLFRVSNQHIISSHTLLTVLESSVNKDILTTFNLLSENITPYRHGSTLDDNNVSEGTVLSSIFSAQTCKHDSISSQINLTNIFERHNKYKLAVVGIVSHTKSEGDGTFRNRETNPRKRHRIRRWKNK